MTVAIRNANDGISLSQVAEGGLAVVTDILQRMRELAVQSINSTNTTGDIAALNQEYTQLGAELDRNMSSVQFNGTSLFTVTGDFTFQVGANAGQTVTVSAADLGVASGAISGILPSSGQATTALALDNSANAVNLSAIDLALGAINSSRATLGAIQSRFSQTITYLQTAVENQTAARGRIMDADFAQETANLSRSQILQQAGTAMIAQANQMPQQVLQLLK
jgi:flagellin